MMTTTAPTELNPLRMQAGSHYIPDREKRSPMGEDAHFVCHQTQFVGVADGVGGWAKKGIDGGHYARQLMLLSLAAAQNWKSAPTASSALKVMNWAYHKNDALGSSTACILLVNGRRLYTANLGDSGFVLIRGGHLLHHSPALQHRFNYPFQLGKASGCRDKPSAAKVCKIAVEEGDLVVAGTDGLFDNVFDEELEEIVRDGLEHWLNPRELARKIALVALLNSKSTVKKTPFSVAAAESKLEEDPQRLGSMSDEPVGGGGGGKPDDISEIVVQLTSSSDDPDPESVVQPGRRGRVINPDIAADRPRSNPRPDYVLPKTKTKTKPLITPAAL